MAQKPTRDKRAQDKEKKKKLQIPPVAILDNIIFSKAECWAYYKINSVPFDFLSGAAKVGLGKSTMTALGSLCQNEGKKVDCHTLITSTPIDVNSWEEQVNKNYLIWGKDITKPYEMFMESQREELLSGDYKKRVTYLGVKLFTRGTFAIDSFNIFEFGFKDAMDTFKKAVSNVFVIPGEHVNSTEEKRAREAEKEIHRILYHGSLRALRPTSEELLLTIKRMFYPFMPSPYLETDYENRVGLNDIVLETGGYVQNGLRYLKFDQQLGADRYAGYRATLSFSRFPNGRLSLPNGNPPFMYMPTQRGMPYTVSSRFTLLPAQDMKKELEKKKLETDDEIKNLGQSGQASNAHIQSTVNDIAELDDELNENKNPWMSGSYRITIEMPTLDYLSSAVSELKQEYAQLDTILTWTSGDQLKLFLEEMPGGSLQMSSFNQMTNLAMMGVSGFNFGGVAGDPIDERLVTRYKQKIK